MKYDLDRDGVVQVVKENSSPKNWQVKNWKIKLNIEYHLNSWIKYDLVRDGDVQVVEENPTTGEGGKENEHRQVDQSENRKWKWKLQNTNQSVEDV